MTKEHNRQSAAWQCKDVDELDRQISELVRVKAQITSSLNQPGHGHHQSVTTSSYPSAGEKIKGNGITLKTPKGTRDWMGGDIVLREHIFSKIISVFKRHGAIALDTPVFERKEVLAGKYGEDSKLIYDLQDQGGELCSLRYDLTVPFARVLAMNPTIQNIKRYHLAKVYRRDQPAIKKGRMREFYQCDFDIAGTYDPMLPDAEVVSIIVETLKTLKIQPFTLKLNHRKILDGIFQVCGVPVEKYRIISSAVDKLDKTPWNAVKVEMTEEKGLPSQVADRLWQYFQMRGGRELIEKLQNDDTLMNNASAAAGLQDMALLFDYLSELDCLDNLSFDLSLARGLDYYTGIIFEAITDASAPKIIANPVKKSFNSNSDADRSDDDTIGLGSILGGGRYDELVGMFSNKKSGAIPCVGFSVGIERIFSILKSKFECDKIQSSETQVFVMAFGGGFIRERLCICKELWCAGINTEFLYKSKPKTRAQFEASEKSGAKVGVILGQDEIDADKVTLKLLSTGDESNRGIVVERKHMVEKIQSMLADA